MPSRFPFLVLMTALLAEHELPAAEPKPLATLDHQAKRAYLGPDGKTLVIANQGKSEDASHDYTIWNVRTARKISSFKAEPCAGCTFSPDCRKVLIMHFPQGGKLFNVATGKAIPLPSTKRGQDYHKDAAAMSADGNLVAVGSSTPAEDAPPDSGKIWLWDVTQEPARQRLVLKTEPYVHALGFSPDGKTLASSSAKTKLVHLWDLDSGKRKYSLPVDKYSAVNLVFSPDSRFLAGYFFKKHGHEVRLWDAKTGKQLHKIDMHHVSSLCFSADGKSLFTVEDPDTNAELVVREVSTGKKRASVKTAKKLGELAQCADGRTLVLEYDRDVKVWDASTLLYLPGRK